MWSLPILVLILTTVISIPLSRYMAWIMDGKYHAPLLAWFEKRLDTGPQSWVQYTLSLLLFNIVLFLFGMTVLSLQPFMPLNSLNRGMLSPSTIFNSTISFMTNTNLQHYSGDQHFSNFTQIFFCIANFFLSASVGLGALAAIIRAFRGDGHVGNYFLDMWRAVVYFFLPFAFVLSLVFVQQGSPMTLSCAKTVSTIEPGSMGSDDKGAAKQQTIVTGPVAAFVPQKMLGTNGGGFFGMNSAHPYENPTALTNFLTTFAMMVFPFRLGAHVRANARQTKTLVGDFLGDDGADDRHHRLGCLLRHVEAKPGIHWHRRPHSYQAPDPKASRTAWAQSTCPPGRAAGGSASRQSRRQGNALRHFRRRHLRRSHGGCHVRRGELRARQSQSGRIAGTDGRHVAQLHLRWQRGRHDQHLVYLIIGVFLRAMVGRTPEYLGKKLSRREMKLAMLALLVHPIMILGPTGLFAAAIGAKGGETTPGRTVSRKCSINSVGLRQ